MEVILDGATHQSKVHGTYHQLDTSDTIMLGTANNNILVQDLTRGHFTQGFQVKFQDSSPCRISLLCAGLYEEHQYNGSLSRHQARGTSDGTKHSGMCEQKKVGPGHCSPLGKVHLILLY